MPSIRRTLATLSSTTRILAFRISAALTMELLILNRLVCREFQRPFESIHELLDPDRFRQITEKSSLQALLAVTRHRIRAEGHHRDVRCGGVSAQDAQSFDAADAGKID